MIGKKLTPILEEIEYTLLEHAANTGQKPNFGSNALRSATYIFQTVILDKMFELQSDEKMDIKDRENMAVAAGNDLRKFIKTYLNIDSHDFYKK